MHQGQEEGNRGTGGPAVGLGQSEGQGGAQPSCSDRHYICQRAWHFYSSVMRNAPGRVTEGLCECSCWAHKGQKEGDRSTGGAAVGLGQPEGQGGAQPGGRDRH